MLETKRINSYGKRSTRIVYVPDSRGAHDSPFTSHRLSRENNKVSHSPPSARKVHLLPRKVHGLSTSPRGSPKSGKAFSKATLKNTQDVTTPRRPLVLKVANVPDSPSIVYLGSTSPTKASRFTPYVDSEIMIIEGPTVRKGGKNKLLHSGSSEEPEVVRPPRKRAPKRPVVVSEDEDDHIPIPKRNLRATQVEPIIISDDTDEDFPAIHPVPKTHALRPPKPPSEQQQPSKAMGKRVQTETTLPSVPKPPHILVTDAPNPPLARALSARRSQRKALLPSLSQNQAQPVILTSESEPEPAVPKPQLKPKPKLNPKPFQSKLSKKRNVATSPHLTPLLAECEQTAPHCFSTFIETFPFDGIHGRNASENLSFRKIGEASYSEVYAIGNVVLKIVPLRNESSGYVTGDPDLDMPQESDTKDVLQEVIVTRAMGHICPGFVKLLRAYVVSGPYPSLLLSLWDDFNGARKSENIRPDIFPKTQAYALIVLPHGGPDLEAYTFPVKTGWRQACSIFWQTAKALAVAEDLVSFEHRDLHWGQILVGSTGSTRKIPPRTPARRIGEETKIQMDDPCHGVTATIIDLGLARMDARDGGQDGVHWTMFDELIFEGEGDYQFDVYRMMRRLHGETWDQYRPLTNVMWLHYILSKLLHAKRLRPPSKRSAPVDGEFSEKQCYECLLEIEELLRSCVSPTKGKKGRGGALKGMFCKAGDVVEFARGRGWVS